MSYSPAATQFAGKIWIFVVQALVCGGLAVFSLLLGPLFLFEIMKDARGQPATDAGVALTVMSIPFLLVFALAVFNLVARRRPVVRLCRQGLAINMIGSSTLDGTPLIPGAIRVAWLVVSLQGFRQQMVMAPWESLRGARVSGPAMAQTLTIAGSMYRASHEPTERPTAIGNLIEFPEVAFTAPVEQIAHAINGYCQDATSRGNLPSWKKI